MEFKIACSYFKAGETLAFEVEIEGEPPAHDIVWTLNGKGAVHKLRYIILLANYEN